MDVRIVELHPADVCEAREYCLKIIKQVYGFDYRADWHADLDSLKDADGVYAAHNQAAFLVAHDPDNNIIGTVGLRPLSSHHKLAARFAKRYKNKRVGSIWRMYIPEDLRSQGLGAQLYDAIECKACQLGFHELYLHTNTQSKAYAFWQKQGFVAFEHDDDGQHTVHMDKPLNLQRLS